jgi:tRNA-2-methylthio-N6-dimethylallyladenosine synthase
MTYFFETYGCQMNHAESASVAELLDERGWTANPDADTADLVIINTCSVRITAETRALSRISLFCSQKKRRDVRVLVMGCMAERLRSDLKKRFKKLDFVVGMFERDSFADIFRSIEDGSSYARASGADVASDAATVTDERPVNAYHFASSSWEKGSFQTFVPIMNGCNNFCTYCIVPYVRGREVSRPMPEILDEFDSLADRGVREVTLLGQNVNSYAWLDPATGETVDFPALLERIARRVERKGLIRWVRFMSSHPKDLSDRLIEVIARERVFCRFLHLPVQHGSDRVLAAMNRRYTRAQYLALVDRVRARIPDVTLSTDILMGFPGETEEDVEETLELIRRVRYEVAFMYHYNPREGTKAFSLPNRIPEEVKKERLGRVIKLQHAVSAELMRERVGKTVTVLVESTSRNRAEELFGHTELGEMVVFSGTLDKTLIGRFVEAELTCLRGRTFRAKMIGDSSS